MINVLLLYFYDLSYKVPVFNVKFGNISDNSSTSMVISPILPLRKNPDFKELIGRKYFIIERIFFTLDFIFFSIFTMWIMRMN